MAPAGPLAPDAGAPFPVRVYTLGRFQVSLEGGPLQFEVRAHRKPLELLKVLIALGGEQVATDLLSEALWPDAEGDQAQASFAPTLHRLRRLIGQEAVLLRDRRLTLNGAQCWVDAPHFTRLLEQAARATQADAGPDAWAHLEQALALYRGPFLEGEFEPAPILSARERLHGQFLRHLGALGDYFAAQGDATRAVELYRRGLELDPLAESLYQALMRLHLEQGQAAEGVATYQRCRELLAAEAGVEPAPETEALHRALLAGGRDRGRESPAGAPGARPEPAVKRSRARAPAPAWGRWVLAAALAAVVAGGALLGWQQRGRWGAPLARPGANAALPLPTEPSIVVLPFDNLTGDPHEDYFARGISDSLTTQLYKVPGLFVIARQSAQVYQGRRVTVQQIGRELGVRYVLEGSVQRSGERLRINAQLIDAATDKHVWAEQYDRELRDVFAAQDAIVRQVATELGVQLSWGEALRSLAGATASYRAYDAYLLADQYFAKFEKEANAKAKELLAESIAADPNFARAVAFMGWAHLMDYLNHWSDDPERSFREAEAWARRALAMDETVYLGHTLMGRILMFKGRHEEAVASTRRALHYEPNNAIAMGSLALQLVYAGHAEEALTAIRTSRRMAPYPPPYFLFTEGYARALLGQHERAVAEFRRYLGRQARGPSARRVQCWLIVSLQELGRNEEARAEVTRLLEAAPATTVRSLVALTRRQPFKEHGFLERHLWQLRRAGLPE